MKSSFDAIESLFSLVNIESVKQEISGKVYSNSMPNGNQDENIVLKVLTNSNQYLQQGYINLNIHVKEITSGRPNLKRMKAILDIVMPLVDDVKNDTYTFQIDDDKGIFKDQEEDSMYFYNLRLKFQTI